MKADTFLSKMLLWNGEAVLQAGGISLWLVAWSWPFDSKNLENFFDVANSNIVTAEHVGVGLEQVLSNLSCHSSILWGCLWSNRKTLNLSANNRTTSFQFLSLTFGSLYCLSCLSGSASIPGILPLLECEFCTKTAEDTHLNWALRPHINILQRKRAVIAWDLLGMITATSDCANVRMGTGPLKLKDKQNYTGAAGF